MSQSIILVFLHFALGLGGFWDWLGILPHDGSCLCGMALQVVLLTCLPAGGAVQPSPPLYLPYDATISIADIGWHVVAGDMGTTTTLPFFYFLFFLYLSGRYHVDGGCLILFNIVQQHLLLLVFLVYFVSNIALLPHPRFYYGIYL